MVQQHRYARNYDLGFDQQNIFNIDLQQANPHAYVFYNPYVVQKTTVWNRQAAGYLSALKYSDYFINLHARDTGEGSGK